MSYKVFDHKIVASIIEKAPDETEEATKELNKDEEESIWKLLARLQNEYGSLLSENEQLKAKVDLGTEKAKLLKPYANKVYLYLCIYSTCVFLLLISSGFKLMGFWLETTVLSVLVGSTAISAIGLVHTVVKGLFGPPSA